MVNFTAPLIMRVWKIRARIRNLLRYELFNVHVTSETNFFLVYFIPENAEFIHEEGRSCFKYVHELELCIN